LLPEIRNGNIVLIHVPVAADERADAPGLRIIVPPAETDLNGVILAAQALLRHIDAIGLLDWGKGQLHKGLM
jgi:DNA primase